MEMRKLFLAILVIIPLGIFAQEVRHVTVPIYQTNEEDDFVQGYYQNQPQTLPSSSTYSSELFRDTLKNSQKRAIHTTFLKNRYRDNWYFSVGGGLALLLSEESRYPDITNTVKPTLYFSLGKWVTPVVGARINITGAKLQGFAIWNEGPAHWGHGAWYVGANYMDPFEYYALRFSTNSYLDSSLGRLYGEGESDKVNLIATGTGQYIEETFLDMTRPRFSPGKGNGYDYFITYLGGSLDLMLNVSNFFGKYKPKRFLDFNLFAGVGYAHTFKEEKWLNDLEYMYAINDGATIEELKYYNPEYPDIRPGRHNAAGQVERTKTAVHSVMGKVGMEMSFRLSNQMRLNIEANTLVLPEFFDRRVGDSNTMDMVANALVGFTYRFKERNFYEPLCQSSYVTKEVYTNNCDDVEAKLKELEDIMQEPRAGYPIAIEHLKIVVYFIIDKWEVRQSEMYKLDEIAKFMNKYPNVRVSIEGYADVQTAYPAYNMKLSERRANEVARILATKYGIERSRLRVTQYGDTVQPFKANELNRAVIAFDIDE